jgi:hypothetical protein
MGLQESFEKQVVKARSQQFRKNRAYRGNVLVGEKYDNLSDANKFLFNKNFDRNIKEAYDRPEGYTFSINPLTGKKEMYIAGTRHKMQWPLNILDTITYNFEKYFGDDYRKFQNSQIPGLGYVTPHFKYLDPWRIDKEKYYSDIANMHDIDVVIGHSRGGALTADLDFGGTKVGVDAAMTAAQNQSMVNFSQGPNTLTELFSQPIGVFDKFIGLGGKKNIYRKSKKFHQVWT